MSQTLLSTPFSDALLKLKMSPIVTISELVRQEAPGFRAKTGQDFIYYQRGEIDFPTPDYITLAAKKALDAGLTKYPKSGGEPVLKDALVAKMARVNDAQNLTTDHIVVTYGGQEALELAFKLFEGRPGAGFAPCWSCILENMVPYNRIDFREVPLNDDFSINWDILEDQLQEVAFFYLNTPQNPTGKVFSKAEITGISDLCEKYGVYLIGDEAYERIILEEGSYFSPAAIEKPHIISCYTFSKTYAMTGWRVGYLVCRDPQIIQLIRLGNYSQTAGVVTFLQYGAAEAVSNIEAETEALAPMMDAYKRRRDLLFSELSKLEGVEVTKPEGAFYFFPNFTALIPAELEGESREKYVFEKLMEAGVAVVYGSCFGKYFTDNVRISYSCTNEDQIMDSIARIKLAFNI